MSNHVNVLFVRRFRWARGCLIWLTLPIIVGVALLMFHRSDLQHSFAVKWAAYAAFSPDGQLFAVPAGPLEDVQINNESRSGSQFIELYTRAEYRVVQTYRAFATSLVAISSDSQLIAAVGADREVRLLRVTDGMVVQELAGHTGDIRCVRFSPNNQLVAVGDGVAIHLWQVDTGRRLQSLNVACGLNDIVFNPTGENIAADDIDGARIWSVNDGRIRHYIEADGVQALTFSPDGRYLALGLGPVSPTGPDDNGIRGAVQLRRVDGAAPQLEYTLTTADFVSAVAFSPDGQYLAAAGERARESGFGLDLTWQAFIPSARQIAIWRVADGQPLQTIRTSHSAIYGLTFGPDGRTLIAQGDGGDPNQGIITVWRVAPQWGWLDWLLPLSVVVAMVGWGVGWWRGRA
jgi:WD40 repeat protein